MIQIIYQFIIQSYLPDRMVICSDFSFNHLSQCLKNVMNHRFMVLFLLLSVRVTEYGH